MGTTCLFVHEGFPPSVAKAFFPASERLARLSDVLMEQAQLARDEGGGVGVAGPGADVDDVEGLVDEGAGGG